MNYTLAQLEQMVSEVLQSGEVNKARNEYPILHLVVTEFPADYAEQTKCSHYLKLIERILKCRRCDPDVFDKHKKSALMYAAEIGNSDLMSLLLQYNADPNLKCGNNGWRALEYGILRNPSSETTRNLKKHTLITKNMFQHFEELFKDALEESEDTPSNSAAIIDVLLDLKLVKHTPKFRQPSDSSGFWIHTIDNVNKEARILKIRDLYASEHLAMQRHGRDYERDQNYTYYTSATFIQPGIPIDLFSSSSPGVMIRPSDYLIHYWYDGRREELTRDFNFSNGREVTNGQAEGQYWELTAKEIQRHVMKRFKLRINEVEKYAQENPEYYDKHGVLLDRRLCDEVQFSWNEGLLRYKRDDVFGIHVNPDSKKCCEEALKLRENLSLPVPLYYYSRSGTVQRIQSQDLIQKWQINPAVISIRPVDPIIPSRGNSSSTTSRAGHIQRQEGRARSPDRR